jgi:transcriptional regulator with XRE-family HTH domain
MVIEKSSCAGRLLERILSSAALIIDKQTGRRIRKLRERKGIGQAELARGLGVTQATISRAEHGMHSPAIPIADLARQLEATPAEIFGIRKGAA